MQRIAVLASLLGALALGCGSDPVSPAATGGTTGTGGAGGHHGRLERDGRLRWLRSHRDRCVSARASPDDSLPKVTVGEITAIVLELDAAPVVEAPVTVCGVDSLQRSAQDQSGRRGFRVPTERRHQTAFKYGERLAAWRARALAP
jgi:hypothetical protein